MLNSYNGILYSNENYLICTNFSRLNESQKYNIECKNHTYRYKVYGLTYIVKNSPKLSMVTKVWRVFIFKERCFWLGWDKMGTSGILVMSISWSGWCYLGESSLHCSLTVCILSCIILHISIKKFRIYLILISLFKFFISCESFGIIYIFFPRNNIA